MTWRIVRNEQVLSIACCTQISISLSLSISLYFSLSLSVSLSLSLSFSISLSLSLSGEMNMPMRSQPMDDQLPMHRPASPMHGVPISGLLGWAVVHLPTQLGNHEAQCITADNTGTGGSVMRNGRSRHEAPNTKRAMRNATHREAGRSEVQGRSEGKACIYLCLYVFIYAFID